MKQLKIRFNGFRDEWVEKKLNDVLIDSNEKSSKDNEFDVLSSTVKDIELRHGRTSSSSSMGYKILDIGQLVLSPQNIWMGNINVNFYKKGLVSPSYKVYDFYTDLLIPEYARIVVKQPNMIYQYNNASVQGASIVRKNLDLNSFNNIPIQLPTLPEQQKIGALFSKYDAIIALREQKLAEMDALKKGLLQQMFPKNGAKVPELRFVGFASDWKERKLGEVAQFNPKTILPDEFEYVALENVVGTEMISHRTESKDQAPSRAQRLAKKGDVFYQMVRPYQMNNYLYDLSYDNYVFSTGYAQMRPNIDSHFLLNSIQNKQFVQHVLDRCTGTSYPAINSSDLSKIEINVPSALPEQQKIGQLFKHLDARISNEQSKIEQLKAQKQGLLQKMIS